MIGAPERTRRLMADHPYQNRAMHHCGEKGIRLNLELLGGDTPTTDTGMGQVFKRYTGESGMDDILGRNSL